MFRLFCQLYFKLNGWTIEGKFEPKPDKYIVIVMPHTANFDFIIGVMARALLKIKDAKYLGKSQLFKFPYGFIFRALGGYPVYRDKNNNLVDAVVDIFDQHEKFAIALAPEGTRSKVDRLKTGFYFIAKKANIPIKMVAFDYAQKKIVIGGYLYPSDNIENDFNTFYEFYQDKRGKVPKLGPDYNVFERTIARHK